MMVDKGNQATSIAKTAQVVMGEEGVSDFNREAAVVVGCELQSKMDGVDAMQETTLNMP